MKITVDPRANKRAVMDALCATLDLISAELPIGALLISRLGRLCAGPSFGQLLPCHVARADRIGGHLAKKGRGETVAAEKAEEPAKKPKKKGKR